MTEIVDAYWSFRSPYSYLAIPDLLKLRDDYQVNVSMRIVLPIAIRAKETVFNAVDKNKVRYIVLDSYRRAEQLGIPFVFPPTPDPIVQDYETFQVAEEQPYIYRLCKLGVEAERRGKGLDFASAVSSLIMGGTAHWDQDDHLQRAVAEAGLDLEELDKAIENGDHMESIEQNHKDLDAAGHWGVPTMVLRNEPFFGQDRFDTLRWRLDQFGLKK